jgi:hypothetical protein
MDTVLTYFEKSTVSMVRGAVGDFRKANLLLLEDEVVVEEVKSVEKVKIFSDEEKDATRRDTLLIGGGAWVEWKKGCQ